MGYIGDPFVYFQNFPVRQERVLTFCMYATITLTASMVQMKLHLLDAQVGDDYDIYLKTMVTG